MKSDWDLLVIGGGCSRFCRGLDLVYVDAESFQGESWRASELASHIGTWGKTLHGSSGWLAALEHAEVDERAIARKRTHLRAQLDALALRIIPRSVGSRRAARADTA